MRVICTSVSKLADAKKLANAMVKKRLAACVSYWKINSAYRWKGKIVEEGECMLEIKISGKRKSGAGSEKALIEFLEKSHPHELPVIYSLASLRCNRKCEKWLAGK